jgi:light-regulated signal transduction histidine kinase (bacteriophytochrome)
MPDSREVLREASVALQNRTVTLWQVSSGGAVRPILMNPAGAPAEETELDLDATLHRWGAPVIEGSRWVGCRIGSDARWCVAPVRTRPAAPPPAGVERRSRERMTLELTGLCLGLIERPSPESPRPRASSTDAALEWVRQPSVIAHEVANPLTAAQAYLDLCLKRIDAAPEVPATLKAEVIEDLTGVSEGIEQAVEFLRAIQDRSRGTLARSERFDALQVVRSCLALERPLARRQGVPLVGLIAGAPVYLQGDPNALNRILTNLIRNAVSASQNRLKAVEVTLEVVAEGAQLKVEDHGVGIPREHLDRIFDPGFTTRPLGAGSGTGLSVVRQLTEEMFGGRINVSSEVGEGSAFIVVVPIPPQRTGRE